MKCDELKKRLADKDQEVKEIRENTIAIFNETKDLIVDDLIQRTIEKEFKGGELIYSHRVYDLILDNAKLEHNLVHNESFHFSSKCILERPFFTTGHIPNGNPELLCSAIEQRRKVDEFFKKFDYELFSSMLKKYILSKGFKQEVITNIWNQKVKTNFFVITRSQLENQCCSTKPVVRNEELNPDIYKALLGLLIICLLIGMVFFFFS